MYVARQINFENDNGVLTSCITIVILFLILLCAASKFLMHSRQACVYFRACGYNDRVATIMYKIHRILVHFLMAILVNRMPTVWHQLLYDGVHALMDSYCSTVPSPTHPTTTPTPLTCPPNAPAPAMADRARSDKNNKNKKSRFAIQLPTDAKIGRASVGNW